MVLSGATSNSTIDIGFPFEINLDIDCNSNFALDIGSSIDLGGLSRVNKTSYTSTSFGTATFPIHP